MLEDSLLPILFWAEAVNTACYVQNRVLVTKPHNKTPYELLHGRTPSIGFMRPFGCPVTILNTLDSLGKFDGKVDEGFLVGYSVSSSGPTWLFDIDTLTKTMNYQPVTAGNQSNPNAGVQEQFHAEKAGEEIEQQYVLFPVWYSGSTNPQNTDGDAAFDENKLEFDEKKHESKVSVSPSSSTRSKKQDDKTKREAKGKSPVESFTGYRNLSAEFEDFSDNNINEVNVAGTLVPTVGQISPHSTNTFSAVGPSNAASSPTHGKSSFIDASQLPDDPKMPKLEDITYSDNKDDVGAEADFNNLETSIIISPIPTTRVHKDHHVTQIIGDLSSATQTRSMTRVAKDQGGLSQINNEDFHTCMFTFFLSQEEPKRVHQALKDPSWIKAMQEELLQFKMQKVWVLVDLPYGKRAIGTKWGFKNKKDEKGTVVRNKARLIAQGHTQEGGIDFEEVFSPVARIEAIRLFLAYASFMGFMVYQMDVTSAFLYGTIEEEVYVYQPLGFEDTDHPNKVYKVVKALYDLHQAPRAWYETLANYLLENSFQKGKIDQTLFIKRQKGDIVLVQIYVNDIIFGSTNKDLCKAFEKLMKDKFQMSLMGELTFFLGVQVKQKKDRIFISKDKYVAEILSRKSASTPIDTEKPLLKDLDGEDIDVNTYRSMISSLMYLTSSRPDIMFAVVLSSMESLQRMVHVTNVLSAGYLTTPQMVLNSPCLTHIKNWLVQIKRSLSWQVQKQTTLGVNTPRCDEDRLELIELAVFLLPSDEKVGVEVCAVDLQVSDVSLILLLQEEGGSYEATIREALHLDDAEGVECLPNEEIFAELARMSYEKPSTKLTFYKAFFLSQWKFLIHTILQCMSAKRTLWNEFSSSMASAVICLSSSRKFNCLKYIFNNLVAEGDVDEVHGEDVNAGNAAEGDVSAANDEVSTADEEPSIPSPIPPTLPLQPSHDIPSTSQGRMKAKIDEDADVVLEEAKDVADIVKDDQDADVEESAHDQGRQAESQAEIYKIDLDYANKVLSIQEDEYEPVEVQEVVDVVTTAKIITEVVTAASTTITAANVQVLAATTAVASKLTASPSRRTKGIVIRDPEESTTTTSTIIHSEARSKDKGKGILVEEPKPLKKQAQIKQDEKYARELEAEHQALKRKPQTEAQARKNMMIYLKNVAGFKMAYFKGMSYDYICLIFEAKFNTNMAFLQKTKEQINKEECTTLKRINETPVEKTAKRKKLDEEVEELKRNLQIVPNEEDDVYTEATPLACKSLVKERFATTKPKNFSDDFLLITLGAMFENPYIHAKIWKNQRSVYGPTKVKSWKLLESCGVQIIAFTTTQLILLVEKKYPLTKFTLDQMLNVVRLEVKEESEAVKKDREFTESDFCVTEFCTQNVNHGTPLHHLDMETMLCQWGVHESVHSYDADSSTIDKQAE
uniref:Putative ribonuclease H-like domain-containing protein n=1 Tax=Tanacetum cinerariifolium TaxID=118510 RepID=A0A6L2LXN4_TANCI|nr:putative ribonuclease H-like domain-containing protein [Tanacetum cinerariifolium]